MYAAARTHAARALSPTPPARAQGQAYTALSRVRRLEQIHLWSLDPSAFRANPTLAMEYERLRQRPLTQAVIDAAPPVSRAAIPMVAAAVSAGLARKRQRTQ